MFSPYDWIYGIAVLSALFLSFIAGFIAVTLFKSSERRYLGAWKYLIVALVLFAFEEFFGALKVFGIYQTAWITHVIPSFILVFLIVAIVKQINITKGCE